MRIAFLGGVGTVTGSKFLVDDGTNRVLVDCGLFQGFKQLRLRNWAPLPVAPESISAVLLTHAHLDHSGYLPLLVKRGFRGRVFCTAPTRDLGAILLADSGFLQEKDAEFANRHGFSKHSPALPLYTRADAAAAIEHFAPVAFGTEVEVCGGIRARFLPAGHILGAAIVELRHGDGRIVFSGDLGGTRSLTMPPPSAVRRADYLVVESTYGNRRHSGEDVEDALSAIVLRTIGRGGTLVVPSFAVGRAQLLLFHLHRLKTAGRIPDLPVFLDSPMAIDASEIFCAHVGAHRLTAAECRDLCGTARYVREVEESKSLDADPMPKIIVSASGMATGGRVLHHLKHYGPDPKNTILLTGFQAGGTRGAALAEGADSLKIHGARVPIRAEVARLDMLSAHADADEILAWLAQFERPPRTTFIVHGEPAAADALRLRIEDELGWNCVVPEYRDEVELSWPPGTSSNRLGPMVSTVQT